MSVIETIHQHRSIRKYKPDPVPEELLEEILEDLQPRIRSVFSRFRIPPHDAEDVLQQTLLTYLYKRDSIYDPKRWLMGALRNRCRLNPTVGPRQARSRLSSCR